MKGFLRLVAMVTALCWWRVPGEEVEDVPKGDDDGTRTCSGVAEMRACSSLFLAFSRDRITSAGLTHGAGDPTPPPGLMLGWGGAGQGREELERNSKINGTEKI